MGTLKDASARGGTIGTGQYVGRTKWARAYYDFATDAGAVGALNLRGDMLPSGALVLRAFVKVATATTSGGAATVSLGVEGAADIRAANAHDNATTQLSTTGNKTTLLTGTTAPLSLTDDRHIVATIGTAALTAGRFSVLVEYVELSSDV